MRRERVAIESLKASGLGTDLTANDWSQLEATAERLLSDGWSALDVRTYLRCTEELNPELSEQVALARMSQIARKYKGESKMVERAGTGPGIDDDTDLFDPEQKAARASRESQKKCRHHFTPSYGERTCLRCHIESLTLMLCRHGVCPSCEGVYSKKPDVLRCLNPECKYQHIEDAIEINSKRERTV